METKAMLRKTSLQLAFSALGSTAMTQLQPSLFGDEAISRNPLLSKQPHFPARAKRVIFLCMDGGPSHVDTFDYKPSLYKDEGKSGRYGRKLLRPVVDFKQRGKGGLWISELFPELSKHADELCLLRGMHCNGPNHPQAVTQLHTGNFQFVRPSFGSWILYGLGTQNDSLPGFVTINPTARSAQNFGSAFLPAIYQGTKIDFGGGRLQRFAAGEESNFPDISNPKLSGKDQLAQLEFIQKLNRQALKSYKEHSGVEGMIESYDLAYRMQAAMPKVMKIDEEPKVVQELYGIGSDRSDAFGKQCLLARRFAQAGVRFIELSHGGWDHHASLDTSIASSAEEIDRPIAGLLADLKRMDMLKETLIVWAGEFGRTPDSARGNGRDHNPKGFTTWFAGGGVKGGTSYGQTDEHGFEAVEDKCHIHDWHATMLHLLGIDHEALTYKYGGRDFRLTDVYGTVVKKIIS